MNFYVRYFNQETLVKDADEIISFLKSIPEIEIDNNIEDDIKDYVASPNAYPKRYKLRPRIYFIIIKTKAETMEEFKENKTSNILPVNQQYGLSMLLQHREGWYEGSINFKRVEMIPGTSKFRYADTRFVVRCKATCGQECYDRIVDHLKDRVDMRSQYPAAKGKNFKFKYLGMWKDIEN